MNILDDLLGSLPPAHITNALVGLHWTAVVAENGGRKSCGLASTLSNPHYHHGTTDVPQAGQLEQLSGPEVAALAKSEEPVLASLGMAAINAMLRHRPEDWTDQNAEEILVKYGAGKQVALIGHFPFVARVRSRVGELHVLEQKPQPGDLPAAAAADILPQAEVVAITGTTLINHTFDELVASCSKQAMIVLLGPSTPLSPLLFEYGLDILCGAVVTATDPVLSVIGQGGNFRQVHRAGVRTVTMARPGI